MRKILINFKGKKVSLSAIKYRFFGNVFCRKFTKILKEIEIIEKTHP